MEEYYGPRHLIGYYYYAVRPTYFANAFENVFNWSMVAFKNQVCSFTYRPTDHRILAWL